MTRYTVVENTPGCLPEDDAPFVGTWDECAAVMDDTIRALVDEGWTVEANNGVGFRLPGGTRQTWMLPPDANEHTLPRVIEVMEAEGEPC